MSFSTSGTPAVESSRAVRIVADSALALAVRASVKADSDLVFLENQVKSNKPEQFFINAYRHLGYRPDTSSAQSIVETYVRYLRLLLLVDQVFEPARARIKKIQCDRGSDQPLASRETSSLRAVMLSQSSSAVSLLVAARSLGGYSSTGSTTATSSDGGCRLLAPSRPLPAPLKRLTASDFWLTNREQINALFMATRDVAIQKAQRPAIDFLHIVEQHLAFEMLVTKAAPTDYRPAPTADHLLRAIRLGGDFGNFITEIRAHVFAQWRQVESAISATEAQQAEWFLPDTRMVSLAQQQVALHLRERPLKACLYKIDQTLASCADDSYQIALNFKVMLSHLTTALIFSEESAEFKQRLQGVFRTLTEGNFAAFIEDVRRDQYCFKGGISVFAAFLGKNPEMTGSTDQQAKKIMEFLASELECTVEKLRYVADRFFNQGILPQVIQGVITAKMTPKNREHFEVVLKSVEVELSVHRGKIVATVCGKGVVFKHLAGVSAAYMPQFSLDVNIRCCFKSSGAIVFNDLELMGSAQDVLSLRQVLGCKDTALQESMILGLVEDRERRAAGVETDLWSVYGRADNFYGDVREALPFTRALWGKPTKQSLEALFEGSDHFSVKPSPPPCPRLMTSAATNAPSKALVVCSMSVLDGLPIPKGFDISNPAHLKSFFLGLLGDGARVLKEPEDEVNRKLVFGASPEEEVARAVSPITTPLRAIHHGYLTPQRKKTVRDSRNTL